ncbi:MAG TPA: nucleotidyltransferase family protein [Gemmatimonadaceae bacterium]|nr:nucleotidyltransferase family protein [Gemmatimonadaceae bacterium]
MQARSFGTGDARNAVALALRLALGRPTATDAFSDWDTIFEVAGRELLAPLAWRRSGRFIRQHADAAVVGAWRRAAMAAGLHGQQQLELLGEATTALDEAGVDAVVLKGIPLGARLYGDPYVRCSADLDLYVPAMQRRRASAALEGLGWRSIDGQAPWHETWSREHADAQHHLELHSSLVCDHLAHVAPGPPTGATTCVDGIVVQAHDGPFVAPYLAAHLATHQMVPLLWIVDFAVLWQSFSEADRLRAELVARQTRLNGYLDWARGRATLLAAAADGDHSALGGLGVGPTGRQDVHSIVRHLALGATIADRARVGLAFLVPRPARGGLASFIRATVARVRTRLGSLAGASRLYDVGRQDSKARSLRALRVERQDMLSLTGDVIRAGGAVWVRAPGGSMVPTIARGALVRIEGLPSSGLAKGDVVLTLTADGEPVLHRIVVVRGDRIVTRGDAAIATDPPVPLSRVIGLATHVRDDTGERPLGRSARSSVASTVLKLRRRVARAVRRDR